MASYLRPKEIASRDGIYYFRNNSIYLKAGQAMPAFENGSQDSIIKMESDGVFNNWRFID
ncbi:MAG: hypothetical protein PHP06_06880 [Clostridia bacterium]|nr:hypothetical protein [Clostridia bacterium]